jgi:hypothetical protein
MSFKCHPVCRCCGTYIELYKDIGEEVPNVRSMTSGNIQAPVPTQGPAPKSNMEEVLRRELNEDESFYRVDTDPNNTA